MFDTNPPTHAFTIHVHTHYTGSARIIPDQEDHMIEADSQFCEVYRRQEAQLASLIDQSADFGPNSKTGTSRLARTRATSSYVEVC